jgi:hypothetical protein
MTPGTKLGPYEIISAIGAGGMGKPTASDGACSVKKALLATRPGRGRVVPSTLTVEMSQTYCNVTNTCIVPVPLVNGSIALPTTAPSMRLRSVPFIAYPGLEEVTSKSPR